MAEVPYSGTKAGKYINPKQQIFKRVKAPTTSQLNGLVHKLSQRIARFLTKQGLLVEDGENSSLSFDDVASDPRLKTSAILPMVEPVNSWHK
jgi:hypothetical protein